MYSGPEGQSSGPSLIHVLSPQAIEVFSRQGDCDNLQVETSPPGSYAFICKSVASKI